MTVITIISKTAKGEEAIRTHLKDKRKESLNNRAIGRYLVQEKIIRENPFTLQFKVKHRKKRLTAEAMKVIIITTLKENGAIIDKDYFIEAK